MFSSASTSKHYPVIVIGAGQAGLSMSYCLKQQGIEHLVLEKSDRVAPAWQQERWDSFCLVTPNWQCQLPGYPYKGDDPNGFMVKDEIIDYLEGYYRFFSPPVLFDTPVTKLERLAGTEGIEGSGNRFAVTTPTDHYSCDQVVMACGGYHEPRIPPAARDMPDGIFHLHSRDYKNPEQLPEGEVLVVGSAQSGAQIAEDLHLEGRKVHLCVGTAPRVHRRYRGKDVVNWLDEMNYYETTIDEHPDGANALHATNHYVTGRDGGRDLNLKIFGEQGMKLYGRLKSADGSTLRFHDDVEKNLDHADAVANRIDRAIEDYIQKNNIDAPPDNNIHSDYAPGISTELDLARAGINSVVWATGFHLNYDWVKLPITDDRGAPAQKRGVSAVDGLYFLGLNWMNTWGSGRFYHVGRDAEYLCDRIREKHAPKAVINERSATTDPDG